MMTESNLTARQKLEAAYHQRCYDYFYQEILGDERFDNCRAYRPEEFEALCALVFDIRFAAHYQLTSREGVTDMVEQLTQEQAELLGMSSELLTHLENRAEYALRRNPATEKQRQTCHAAVPHGDAQRSFMQGSRVVSTFPRVVADLSLPADMLTAANRGFATKHERLQGKLQRKLNSIRGELAVTQKLDVFSAGHHLAKSKLLQAVYEYMVTRKDPPYSDLPPPLHAMLPENERNALLQQLDAASAYDAAVHLVLLEYFMREATSQLKMTLAEHHDPFVKKSIKNAAIVRKWQEQLTPLVTQIDEIADDLLQGDGSRHQFSRDLKKVANGMRIAISSYVTKDEGQGRS